MNHAPVHTTGEPVSPAAARELDDLDAELRRIKVPLMIGPDLADRFIERYGRLPANCEVYVVLGTAPRDLPTAGDLLPEALAMSVRTALKLRRLPDSAFEPSNRPAGRAVAQWKRERYGRGRA